MENFNKRLWLLRILPAILFCDFYLYVYICRYNVALSYYTELRDKSCSVVFPYEHISTSFAILSFHITELRKKLKLGPTLHCICSESNTRNIIKEISLN